MKTALLALAALPLLGACASGVQASYDARVRQDCRELPTPDERLACNRAAQDAEIERRAEELKGK